MFKIVLYKLASSKCTETPFLVVIMLLVWEDTPWNSATISSHGNMSTLVHIHVGHMHFVPAHRKSDNAASSLSLAKWPMEFVLISNEVDCEAFLNHDRINLIMAPTIEDTCRLTSA